MIDYFPLKSLQIYDFATSVITKETVKNLKHLKITWDLQLILRQGDTYFPYQSQGECLIPPTALEFLTNY
ncbi:hypothetical protein [Spiroplasma sp. DGKH1]|uniref:hypothetical protein n=1 Tax=Spiroplasma sp. DGKH1 TaxID=3050074 RepID=UPI0034C68683